MKRPGYTFLLFIVSWIVGMGLYAQTSGAGFVTDHIGWLITYKAEGWRGLFNAFGDRSLHFVYHLAGFTLWKILGLNGTAWMLVFTGLHAVVAALSFNVFNRLFIAQNFPAGQAIAIAGALLFLVNPYQTEVLVWYACVHYLLCTALILLAFRFLLCWLQSENSKWIAVFYVCYSISLFTLEIGFTFPLILILFFLLWPDEIFKNKSRFRLIKIFVLPSLALLIVYLVLSKILRGSMVGHYGAAQHLNFNVPLLMGNLGKYTSKLFFFTQFVPHHYHEKLYLLFENPTIGWIVFGVLACAAAAFGVLYKKVNSTVRIPLLLFAFFVLALAPILNLFFSDLVNIEGDRFSYFASVFSSQLIALVFVLFFRRAGWVFVTCCLLLSIYFLHINTQSWSNCGKVSHRLVESYRWFNYDRIYILNLPDNFNGAYMFRTFPPDNAFGETLTLYGKEDVELKMRQVLSYNMVRSGDSVTVERTGADQIKVTFAQWGNWWWAGGKGGSDYYNEEYSIKIDEWGHSYLLTLKDTTSNSVFLYQCGKEWREFH